MFITLSDTIFYSTAFGTNGRSLLALGGWIGSWEVWALCLRNALSNHLHQMILFTPFA